MRPLTAIGKPKNKLRDGPAVLKWVLTRFWHRIGGGLGFDASNRQLSERVAASLTLTRAAAAHATAVLGCTRRRVSEAAISNVRTMLELWADHRLVLEDESGAVVRRMYVAGALEIARREENKEFESAVKKKYPNEAAEIEKLRRFAHWSGRPRKKVIEDACGAHYGLVYEMYSWDVHPIAQVALDVHAVNAADHKYQIRHRVSEPVVAKQVSVIAAHIVRDMWNRSAPLLRRPPS